MKNAESRLEGLCSLIFKSIKEGALREGLLYELSEECLDGLDSLAVVELPDSFCRLYEYAASYCKALDARGTFKETVYICRIYQLLDLMKQKTEQRKNQEIQCKYRSLSEGQYKVFEGIYDNPGISQTGLVEYSGKKKSALSQYLSGLYNDKLIKCTKIGREKQYYLTPQGLKVYQSAAAAYREKKKSAEESSCTIAPIVFDNLVDWAQRLKTENKTTDRTVQKGFCNSVADDPINKYRPTCYVVHGEQIDIMERNRDTVRTKAKSEDMLCKKKYMTVNEN